MKDNIFVSDRNPVSNRWAIFEEDEYTGWLYLTGANTLKPIADCWIYNIVEAEQFSKTRNNVLMPRPAPIEYAGMNYLKPDINESNITFKWSNDGNSVAILIYNYPMGFIISGEKIGYSRNLIKNCDWGNVFCDDKYRLYFGNEIC